MFNSLSRNHRTRRFLVITGIVCLLFAGAIFAGFASNSWNQSGSEVNIESETPEVDGESGIAGDIDMTDKKKTGTAAVKADVERTEVVTEDKKIAFDKTTVVTDDLPQGVSQVLKEGVEGLVRITYRITYYDGASPKKEEINRTTVSLPESQVIAVGTRVDPGTGDQPADSAESPAVTPEGTQEPTTTLPDDTGCIYDPTTADTICLPRY